MVMKPATKLKIKRLERGLCRRELGERIGYSGKTICNVDNRLMIASEKLQDALAAFFKCDRRELFDHEGFAIRSA